MFSRGTISGSISGSPNFSLLWSSRKASRVTQSLSGKLQNQHKFWTRNGKNRLTTRFLDGSPFRYFACTVNNLSDSPILISAATPNEFWPSFFRVMLVNSCASSVIGRFSPKIEAKTIGNFNLYFLMGRLKPWFKYLVSGSAPNKPVEWFSIQMVKFGSEGKTDPSEPK